MKRALIAAAMVISLTDVAAKVSKVLDLSCEPRGEDRIMCIDAKSQEHEFIVEREKDGTFSLMLVAQEG